MNTEGDNGDGTRDGTRMLATNVVNLSAAYSRAVLGIVELGCTGGRHRSIGRAGGRMALVLSERLVLKMVRPLLMCLMGGVRVGGVGVGIRRMFPTLVRKLRHGPLCEGPEGGLRDLRDLDEGRSRGRRLVGQIASGLVVCDATNLVWTGLVWSGGAGSEGPSDSLRDPSLSRPILSWPSPFPGPRVRA